MDCYCELDKTDGIGVLLFFLLSFLFDKLGLGEWNNFFKGSENLSMHGSTFVMFTNWRLSGVFTEEGWISVVLKDGCFGNNAEGEGVESVAWIFRLETTEGTGFRNWKN